MRGRCVRAILIQQSSPRTFSRVMRTSLKSPCFQNLLMAFDISSPGTDTFCPTDRPEKPIRT